MDISPQSIPFFSHCHDHCRDKLGEEEREEEGGHFLCITTSVSKIIACWMNGYQVSLEDENDVVAV